MKLIVAVLTVLFLCAGIAGAAGETALVVYNSDLGLVRELVELDLSRGIQAVPFTSIPERIDPTSVRLDLKGAARLLEQDFRFDPPGLDRMAKEYLNKSVNVWLKGGTPFSATLLAGGGGDIVLKDASGKVHILRPDTVERIEFPALPSGIANRPTLTWKLDAANAGKAAGTVSYLTGGMNWHAEYGAVVNDSETAMDLSSFVTIENSSGRSYDDVSLKLVAGSVHRAAAPVPAPMFRAEKSVMMAAGAADMDGGFEERAISDYHVYDLRGRTTLTDGGTKQIAFIDPVGVKVARRFVFDSTRNRKDVTTVLEFVNAEKEGPGVPLPAGKVRVYRRDDDGSALFLGEDSIAHTPKGEKVRLTLGAAFDIKSERKVMDARAVSQRVNEQTIEINLRNRKTEQVAVTVIERLQGDWEIVQKSHPFVKKDATTVEFEVKIPAGGEITLSYTARFTY